MERLHKFLSRAGVSSRRAAEQLIVDGKVKVNGDVVTVLGTQIDPDKDLVVVQGQPVEVSAQRKYFLFYKPPGVVTTLSDPQGRPTISDFTKVIGSRVFPVGRLDFDAEGALLLTDDGELANKLMHPSHQVPRVYLAKVKGEPDDASLAKLVAGVRLEDGMAHATEARRFEKAEKNTWIKLIVTEGRQHLVKRLCAAIGHPVVRLFRPAHASLPVSGLKPGEFRALSDDEVARVKALAEGQAAEEPPLSLPARRHGHGFGFDEEGDGAVGIRGGGREGEFKREGGLRRGPREFKGKDAHGGGDRKPPRHDGKPERAERPFTGGGGDRKHLGGGERPGDPATRPFGGGGARKPFARSEGEGGDRPSFGGRERKSFGDRDGGERKLPRKPFERKSYGEGRDSAPAERTPYGKPAFGAKKAFGDRKPSFGGDRKPSFGGDRKPSFGGDRKPSFGGDRKPSSGGDRKSSFGDRKPAFGDRKSSFGGERKSFGDRKPGFGDRDARGGDRKSFGDRDARGGDRKSFGDRDARGGERKSFGAKKSFGDRKPGFGDRDARGGDRKSFGDRKPSGDRAFKPDGERRPFKGSKTRAPFRASERPAGKRTGGKPGGKPGGAGGKGKPRFVRGR
jgi:23S rRNA pseudouridine2605 synthase